MTARFSVLGGFVLALALVSGCGKPTPAEPPKENVPLRGPPSAAGAGGKKTDKAPGPSATSQ